MHRRKENLYPKELNKNIFLLLHKLEIQLYDWNKYTVEIRGTNICFRGTKVKPYLHNQKSIEIFHANKIERRKNLRKYNRNLQDDGKKKNGKNLQITSNTVLSFSDDNLSLVCSSFIQKPPTIEAPSWSTNIFSYQANFHGLQRE